MRFDDATNVRSALTITNRILDHVIYDGNYSTELITTREYVSQLLYLKSY